MKKVLIYGFRPFKKYKKNISAEVVKRIAKDKNIKKIILPIVYKKEYILNKIKKYQPDIIIGFGQTWGKSIRIERKTKNVYEMERPKGKRIIKPKGPREYLVNLKLKKIPETRISYNPGEHLCNFTMYVIMDFIRKRKLNTKFGFVHIPRNYNLRKAVKIIKKLISQIEN